ncbi:MAG: hypothetical protein CMH56_01995 [Myxococcales bacterium]|nr:hypothetical protein [Myxococcales bacterium]
MVATDFCIFGLMGPQFVSKSSVPTKNQGAEACPHFHLFILQTNPKSEQDHYDPSCRFSREPKPRVDMNNRLMNGHDLVVSSPAYQGIPFRG